MLLTHIIFHFLYNQSNLFSINFLFFYILKLSSSWGMLLIHVFFFINCITNFLLFLQTKIFFFFNFLNQIIYFSYKFEFLSIFFLYFIYLNFLLAKSNSIKVIYLDLCAIRFLKVLLMIISFLFFFINKIKI